MKPRILGSARRHGCADEDIFHAYRHPNIDQITEDNQGRFARAIVGPARNGELLELLVTIDHDERIFHAMPARDDFPR